MTLGTRLSVVCVDCSECDSVSFHSDVLIVTVLGGKPDDVTVLIGRVTLGYPQTS